MVSTFTTHTGEVVSGDRLQKALNKVADDCEETAIRIRNGKFADHVPDCVKDKQYQDSMSAADAIRKGVINSFTIWQRVNEALTNECVPLFPPVDQNEPTPNRPPCGVSPRRFKIVELSTEPTAKETAFINNLIKSIKWISKD